MSDPTIFRLYFASQTDCWRVERLAGDVLLPDQRLGQEVRNWAGGELFVTPHEDAARLYRRLAADLGITVLEGDDIPPGSAIDGLRL